MNFRVLLFFLLITLCLIPNFLSSALALVLGIGYAAIMGKPANQQSAKWGGYILKSSVIGLGFGINFSVMLQAGKDSALITSLFVLGVLTLGYFLAKWFGLEKKTGLLISTGSAICGGSAIAAVGSVVKADATQLSVSIGVVFLLNAVALVLFPPIGHLFHLSQTQFGNFAAIAIHDMSSVVGASAKYGDTALQVASITKMLRVLWIIPITIALSYKIKDNLESFKIPTFIFLFVIASGLYSFLPQYQSFYEIIYKTAKQLMILSLFLIGTSITMNNLKQVGIKVFLQATLLWLVTCAVALIYVKYCID